MTVVFDFGFGRTKTNDPKCDMGFDSDTFSEKMLETAGK